MPSAVFTPVWIAIDKGYFKQHGLDVKLEQIEGVTQAQAIIAGQVPIGNVGGTEVLDSRVGGADLIGILQGTDSPVFEIHAPPAVTNVDDLKGKTIAITRIGSSTDLATRVILENHGLKADQDVKLLGVNNMPGILAALQTGQVQAGTMSPPTTAKANAAGFPKLASALD
ncbi:MAG: ABC transporter substrate-binding protein, partial [Chloroflexota bacterium]